MSSAKQLAIAPLVLPLADHICHTHFICAQHYNVWHFICAACALHVCRLQFARCLAVCALPHACQCQPVALLMFAWLQMRARTARSGSWRYRRCMAGSVSLPAKGHSCAAQRQCWGASQHAEETARVLSQRCSCAFNGTAIHILRVKAQRSSSCSARGSLALIKWWCSNAQLSRRCMVRTGSAAASAAG
jgi:hypothetical protein